jgi:hypothetical protein
MMSEVFAKMSKSQKVTINKHQEEKHTFVGLGLKFIKIRRTLKSIGGVFSKTLLLLV